MRNDGKDYLLQKKDVFFFIGRSRLKLQAILTGHTIPRRTPAIEIALRIIRVAGLCTILLGTLFVTTLPADETYTNPVLVEVFTIKTEKPDNFSGLLGIGDPSVIFYEDKYYLYPTGNNHSYDVYVSTDLVHSNKGPKVFRSSEPGVWAPDVFFHPLDRKFYLYYTVNMRIGVATANRPDGVFEDYGTLIRNAIDAHMFLDEDGKYYLYYVQYPGFRIFVQPMETPLHKKGEPLKIIQPTETWEKKPYSLTEAPWMLKHRGVYYLLYSGGGADTQDYAIGYATAKNPTGPFRKYEGNPIVKKGKGVYGPGHCSVIKAPDGRLWMVYHQQKDESRGWNRIICIDRLWFDDKGVLNGKATRGVPQPSPVGSASSHPTVNSGNQ